MARVQVPVRKTDYSTASENGMAFIANRWVFAGDKGYRVKRNDNTGRWFVVSYNATGERACYGMTGMTEDDAHATAARLAKLPVHPVPEAVWMARDEMITTEYAGRGRMDGTHRVRVFWRVTREESLTLAKRAAEACVRAELKPGKGAQVSFVGMDLDTHSSPQLAAIMVYRLRTAEEIARRALLAERTYTTCDRCADRAPGQLVRMKEGQAECALCFTCWHPVRSTCKVLHWINRYGKLQLN